MRAALVTAFGVTVLGSVGCGTVGPVVPDGGEPSTHALSLSLTNNTTEQRVCRLSFNYPGADGNVVDVAIFIEATIEPGQKRSGVGVVPNGAVVTVVAGCHHPDWPTTKPNRVESFDLGVVTSDRAMRLGYVDADVFVLTSPLPTTERR